MKRVAIKKGLLLCAGLALVSACAKSPQAAPHQASVPVSAYKVTPHDLPETLLLPGRILPKQQTPIVAAVPGKIDHVYAAVGDTVHAGQLLATVQTTAGQSDLQEAQQTLSSLEQQAAKFQATPVSAPGSLAGQVAGLQAKMQQSLNRLVAALQKQDVNASKTELLSASRDLLQLQSDVTRLETQDAIARSLDAFRAPMLQGLQAQIVQARQAVKLAQAEINAGRLTAPADGTILTQLASAGMPAAPGTPLFTLGDLKNVELEILVDPSQLPKLHAGQAVSVKVGDQPAVSTTLSGMSPAIEPQSKSFTATAPLGNAAGSYKPGMTGQATITLDPHKNVLAVPTAALISDENGTYVLAIQKGHAVKKSVTTGYSNGTLTEIRSGLSAGDQIVSEGVSRTENGSPVNIVSTNAETAP